MNEVVGNTTAANNSIDPSDSAHSREPIPTPPKFTAIPDPESDLLSVQIFQQGDRELP